MKINSTNEMIICTYVEQQNMLHGLTTLIRSRERAFEMLLTLFSLILLGSKN